MKIKQVIDCCEGHGSLNLNRICRICKTHPTVFCDGGFETCTNKDCKSHSIPAKERNLT